MTNSENAVVSETLATPGTVSETLTIDQLLANLETAKTELKTLMMGEDVSDSLIDAAIQKRENAKKELKRAELLAEKIAKENEIAAKKNAKITDFNSFLALHVRVASGEEIPEYANEYTKYCEEITKTVTIHVPMGMTGKTLAKTQENAKQSQENAKTGETNGTSKRSQIFSHLDAGLSVDDIENLGFSRKEISDTKWHWLRKNAAK